MLTAEAKSEAKNSDSLESFKEKESQVQRNDEEKGIEDEDTTKVNCWPVCTSLYILFMLWRYTSIVLYAVYATECFFRAKLATPRCDNFNVYPFPTQFEIAWQVSSTINSIISIAILVKFPHFLGFLVIAKKLVHIARFWSLTFQLIVVITYNIILFLHEHLVISSFIEVGFILEEVTITVVVCLWNFMPAPNKNTASSSFQFCYYLTLVAYFMENLYLVVLMSSQAALDITGIHGFEQRPAALQAVGIVMNATEATFYFAVMKFFWNKIFEPDRDLFEKETF